MTDPLQQAYDQLLSQKNLLQAEVERLTRRVGILEAAARGDKQLMDIANRERDRLQSCERSMRNALKAMMEGCEFRSIAGDPPYWHVRATPSHHALDLAREAIAHDRPQPHTDGSDLELPLVAPPPLPGERSPSQRLLDAGFKPRPRQPTSDWQDQEFHVDSVQTGGGKP